MKNGKFMMEVFGMALVLLLTSVVVQAQTIHLVTVADFRSFRGSALDSVKKDVANITSFFKRNVPTSALKIYNVDGDMATPEAIIQTISEVKPEKKDTLVFYYSGHAANAADQGGQFLQLKDKKGNATSLTRAVIRNSLCDKNTHLVVLLTDCCNVFAPQERDKEIWQYASRGSTSDFSPVIKKLFLTPSGVADITSSKIGQYSYTGESGSIATVAWIATFESLNSVLNSSTAREVSWQSAIQEFSVSADKVFKAKYPKGAPPSSQKTQVPHAYEFPSQPRFGVRVVTLESGNVLVTEVLAGSPGETIGLKKGDLITRINGSEVLDEPAYSKMIDISARNAEITFKRDSKEQTVKVELCGLPTKPLDEPTTYSSNQQGSATADPAVYGNQQNGTNQNQGQNGQRGTATTSGPVFGASVQGQSFVKVEANSPASLAGIEVGDLLVKFNDLAIRSAKDFANAVDQSPVNAVLVIQKKKTGSQTQVNVRLNKSEGDHGNTAAGSDTTSQGTAEAQASQTPVFGASVQGNRIVKIVPNSPAAKAGLAVNDVILKFNQREIKSAEDFSKAVDESEATASLLIRDGRSGQEKNVNVNLAK